MDLQSGVRKIGVEPLLIARLLSEHTPAGGAPCQEGDSLVGVPEVARMIGLSTSWVEKHVKVLPPRVSVHGMPRWRRSDIHRWVKARPDYGSGT